MSRSALVVVHNNRNFTTPASFPGRLTRYMRKGLRERKDDLIALAIRYRLRLDISFYHQVPPARWPHSGCSLFDLGPRSPMYRGVKCSQLQLNSVGAESKYGALNINQPLGSSHWAPEMYRWLIPCVPLSLPVPSYPSVMEMNIRGFCKC